MKHLIALNAALAVSLVLSACSEKKTEGGEDTGLDADAPLDVIETTEPDGADPDVPVDVESEPDATTDPVEEDGPEDPGSDETPCTEPYVVMSDYRVSVTASESTDASLVWTGSEFGVSWNEGGRIYFARIDSSGSKIGTDHEVGDAGYVHWPVSLVWTGSEYGVSWQAPHPESGLPSIFFRRFSSTGSTIGTELNVPDHDETAEQPSLAWTGSEYGVCWQDGRAGESEIYFVPISSAGSKVGSDVRITNATGNSHYPSLVWTGSEYGVSWNDYRDGFGAGGELYFARFSAAGSKVGSDLRLTTAIVDMTYPSLAWTGSEYGVSWEDGWTGSEGLWFSQLTSTGTEIGTLSRFPTGSASSKKPSLVWAGSEYAVCWHDNRDDPDASTDPVISEIYLARIDSSGAKIGSDIRITSNAASSEQPSIVWTGSELGVAWQDDRFYSTPSGITGNEIHFNIVRYCP